MSLADREILELNGLCDAVVEGTATPDQCARLESWIASDEEARQFYVRALDLSASLGRYASEMQMGPADRTAEWQHHIAPQKRPTNWTRLAVAACLLLAAALGVVKWRGQLPSSDSPVAPPAEFVARITGAKAGSWNEDSAALQAGAFLRRGQRIALARGFAEITFDSGAVVLLQGPAELDVNSAWEATLRRGILTANVPPPAIGFRVSNPAVDVVDLGTEFSMVADGAGTADVYVLAGEVEAMPRGADEDVVLMHTRESRRFGQTSVSPAANSAEMFELLSQSVSLDRPGSAFGYVRWNLDEARGRLLAAEGFGHVAEAADLTLRASSASVREQALVEGVRGRALRFDGRLIAKAQLPGLSGDSPRTISFWVRIPEDAQLSNAYSMVAWRADGETLGSRPVHIGWNRNPAEGPLGAIRTDFSGGHAMGMTPLRDGRWHHVSVVFLPGVAAEAATQVKQYVDGHLESNTITRGERRSIAANANIDADAGSADWLWLGCRLGANGPKRERFRGEMDDLVIADRSLDPAEIVQLMNGPALDVAAR